MADEKRFTHIPTGESVPGKRLVVWLPRPIHDRLKSMAARKAQTMGDYLLEVIEGALDEDTESGAAIVP